MINSKGNNTIRIILFGSILSFLLALGSGYLSIEEKLNAQHTTDLDNHLTQEYERVKNLVASVPPSEIDFSLLHNSIYDVFIQKNDSTVYWNNYVTTLDNLYNSSPEYIIKYKDKTGDYTKMIGLDLSYKGKVQNILREEYFMQMSTQLSDEPPLQLEDYSKKVFSVIVQPLKSLSSMTSISMLFYLLTLIFILVSLYNHTFVKRMIKPWLFLMLSAFLAVGIHYFILPIYKDSFLYDIKNTWSVANPGMLHFTTNLIFFTAFITWLKRTRVLAKTNAWISNISAPFLVTSGFIYTSFLAKGFLFSEPLHSYYNELIQYKLEGFIFLLLFICMLALLFYLSVVSFKTTRKMDSSINKYFCWGIALILTYPISIYLDIIIPLWTLYTFIVSYLLIIELSLENKERKITYAFWWIIILSGFLASITFFYRLYDGMTAQTENIRKLYAQPVEDHSDIVANIDSILQSSDIFPQLSSLSYPSRLDKNDFEGYIANIIQQGGADIRKFDISLEATDQQGLTLFVNHFSTSYSFSQSIATANRLSEFIFFNPFDNAYFLNYQIENESFNSSPLKLSIEIDFYRNGNQEFLEKMNYLIFKKDKVIHNHLISNSNLSQNEIQAIDESQIVGDISFAIYKPERDVKIVAFSEIGGLIKTHFTIFIRGQFDSLINIFLCLIKYAI